MKQGGLAALVLALTLGGCATRVPPIKGNDTGGIIASSPAAARDAPLIARENCAAYGKIGRVTSVRVRYGEYITYACRFPRGWRR